ncbi:Fic family protein [Deinococcus antarcticus]|uniref:protein adenylyltransferase n=1 Tax=Deinococcus antarcticus TaxID=1298767 RepID=A0ABV8A2B2_9DEIO
MTDRHLDEGAITSARIIALRADPVQGHYDSAHLKEIHRRIFEPLLHHHPGEFRPDSSAHRKTRELEGQSMRYVVDYAGGDLQRRVDTILEGVQAGVALKGLSQDEFSRRISQLYADLDHAHPFREGNSRTLREFTHQLAQNAGYELEWSSTNADAEARNRLYVARDVAVYERHYPGLSDQFLRENSRHP